jgi:hypothetical protein
VEDFKRLKGPCTQIEIEQLEETMASRHKSELGVWEQANVDADASNTSIVEVSTGLYDLKIGDREDKHAKVGIYFDFGV